MILLLTKALYYILTRFVSFKCSSLVLYKDDNFIFLNKPYDMMINCNDKSKYTIQSILRNKYPNLAMKNLFHEFYFPHRLDYATSGVLCIPLTKSSCRITSKAFERRLIKKYYVALVRGHVSKEFLRIRKGIGNDLRKPEVTKMCVESTIYCTSPRYADTFILVLETGFFENYPATKILLRPITGRRHQLRVHCNDLGHTIVGDYTYSNKKDFTPHRMYLHCLRLIIPNGKDNLDVETSYPFSDFQTRRNWISFKIYNDSILNSFAKLENLIFSCIHCDI